MTRMGGLTLIYFGFYPRWPAISASSAFH